ncbi:MAG: hypothetical protein HOI55_07170 [Candidatus Marinimicrobia bacterium]|jgi:hypothetical protein|nr:hypothetical protein [Candidatus Neomarinimicrobiota bacterium]
MINKISRVFIFQLFLIITIGAQSTFQFDIQSKRNGSSGEERPFWSMSNYMGAFDYGPFISISSMNINNAFFDMGFSFILYPSHRKHSYMPIGFVSKKKKYFKIKIGRWKKNITTESDLSTGSLIQSNNAIPIPKISLSVPNYNKVIIFKQEFWIKGGFSHGWFSKGEYVQAPLLHEKYLYIKKPFNNNSALSIGVVHEAIWGGATKNHGKQQQSFSDFVRVISFQSASKIGIPQEQINALGNHLGVWDITYFKNSSSKDLKLYFQHPFEDKSSAFQHFFDELKKWKIPVNSFDGLFGIEIYNKKSRLVSKFLYEYLNTMNQSGPEAASDSTYGWDNYYNHYIYQSGWTYKGRVIGNPLFTLGENEGHYSNGTYIVNNRLKAHHIGVSGNISEKITHKILLTYSKNYGTYTDQDKFLKKNKPYRFSSGIKQLSALAQLDFVNVWGNMNIRISYAIDRGDLLMNSESLLFSISYNFSNLSPSQ